MARIIEGKFYPLYRSDGIIENWGGMTDDDVDYCKRPKTWWTEQYRKNRELGEKSARAELFKTRVKLFKTHDRKNGE